MAFLACTNFSIDDQKLLVNIAIQLYIDFSRFPRSRLNHIVTKPVIDFYSFVSRIFRPSNCNTHSSARWLETRTSFALISLTTFFSQINIVHKLLLSKSIIFRSYCKCWISLRIMWALRSNLIQFPTRDICYKGRTQ